MKILLLFIFIFSLIEVETRGQTSITKAYKKELRSRHLNPTNAKYIKGYWKGLEIIIDSTKKYYGIDLNNEDTLFIVTSHPDFVIGGFDEAKIWNRKIKLFSYNFKNFETNKFYKRVQRENNFDNRSFPILDGIDEINVLMETHRDDLIFKNYMEKCDYADGNIYDLIWIVKKDNQFKIKSLLGRLCIGMPWSNK